MAATSTCWPLDCPKGLNTKGAPPAAYRSQVVHVEMVRAYSTLLGLVMRRGRLLQALKVRANAPRLALVPTGLSLAGASAMHTRAKDAWQVPA